MKLTTRNIWQLYLAIPIFHSFTNALEFSKFKRNFNDTIKLSRRYTTLRKIPLMSCCVHCQHDERCNGVSYQEATQTCELNDRNSFYDVFDPETGGAWVVYTMKNAAAIGDFCETDTDCRVENSECINRRRPKIPSRCACIERYRFVEESRACVQVCESYGATFTRYPSTFIKANHANYTWEASVEECREFCLSLNDQCRAFIMKNRKCTVKTLTVQRAIDGHVFCEGTTDSDVYNRDCE